MRNILIGVIMMNIKSVVKVAKVVWLATTVIPPVLDGTKFVVKTTTKIVKNKIENSEKLKDIKKDFELRREGVHTVKYTEV
jgi:hypothetical protein